MPETPEQELAALLRVLRAAPAAWVTAASEIPRLDRDVEHPPDFATAAGEPTHEPEAALDPEHERSPERS
jgi:hypothetical protein